MNKQGLDDVAKRYDEVAEEYDEAFQSEYRTEIQNDTVFSTLNEFLNEKKYLILDAGGGTGLYSIPFAVQGHEILRARKLSSNLSEHLV